MKSRRELEKPGNEPGFLSVEFPGVSRSERLASEHPAQDPTNEAAECSEIRAAATMTATSAAARTTRRLTFRGAVTGACLRR